jgi:hypothetical protein
MLVSMTVNNNNNNNNNKFIETNVLKKYTENSPILRFTCGSHICHQAHH